MKPYIFAAMSILIADSGSTKCEWCMVDGKATRHFLTQGMSPYFLDATQLEQVVRTELLPGIENNDFSDIYFYGTGTKDPANAIKIKNVLQKIFSSSHITVNHDLTGAARALCGHEKGIACILGTGSNSCYYNGSRIVRNSPGIGFILGDEGSGAHLGKKVVQYYLYGILENSMKEKFEMQYALSADQILENVYRKPLPNRFLAAFTRFLSENRGHYMIENIIEDGLTDFFSIHLSHYPQVRKYPVHFTGGIAWHFRDVVERLCHDYGMTQGVILQNPMDGLVNYHFKQ